MGVGSIGSVHNLPRGNRFALPDIVYFSLVGSSIPNYLSKLPEDIRKGNISNDDKIEIFVKTGRSTGARIGCQHFKAGSVGSYAEELSDIAYELYEKRNIRNPLKISETLEKTMRGYGLLK